MMLISFLGQAIGFLIFIGVIVLIVKSTKLHPEQFELMDGEEIIKNVKGDYWQKTLGQETQNSGEFAFTNKRVMFRSMFQWFGGLNITISYNEIVSVEKANVKGIMPVAFIINIVNGESYKFAIMKRDIYIYLINSIIQKTKEENAQAQ